MDWKQKLMELSEAMRKGEAGVWKARRAVNEASRKAEKMSVQELDELLGGVATALETSFNPSAELVREARELLA